MNYKFQFLFITFTFIFGVVFYDVIGYSFGFTYIDEISAIIMLLTAFAFKKKKSFISFNARKQFKGVICILIFYLIYSFFIQSNTSTSIITDFIIQLKPFIALFCGCIIGFHIAPKYKKTVRLICLLLIPYFLYLGIFKPYLYQISGGDSRFATMVEITGILYFYCSKRRKTDIFIMLAIIAIGILSTKAKCYAFVILSVFIFIFVKSELKMSFRHFLLISLFGFVTFYVAWEKFAFYFIIGSENKENMFARPALYATSVNILTDYIPFGSGLGSYATYASTTPYSKIYYKYNLSHIDGLGDNSEDGAFICDTFYPSLAQFGFVGCYLFFLFFYRIYKQSKKDYEAIGDINTYRICLLIISFFLIESSTDSTFTHNRGMFMFILLALFFNEQKLKQLNISNLKQSIK